MSTPYAKPEVIVHRNESLISALTIKIEELSTSHIYGVWNHLIPEVFSRLLDNIKIDVADLLKIKNTVKYDWLITINDKLEEILSHVENLINSTSSNTAVHEFISYVLRDLKLSENVPYIICEGEQLSTLSLITDWKRFFEKNIVFFKNSNNFIQDFRGDYKDVSIIFLPPIVLQNKEYWCLILHEIGHILNDHFSLVKEFNRETTLKEVDTKSGQNYFHAREYISDFIAAVYMGPVLYDCLHEYLLTVRKYYGGTHPPWDARMFFLQKNNKIVISKKLITAKPSKNHETVDNLNKIINKTIKNIFKEKQMYYKKVPKEESNALKSLEDVIPYIGSPRILLNTFHSKKNKILKKLISKMPKGENTPEMVASAIIEDSIRLTNMRNTFQLMEKSSKVFASGTKGSLQN